MHEAGERKNQNQGNLTGRSFYRKNNLKFKGRNRNRSRSRGQKNWDPEPEPEPEPRQNGTVPQHWYKDTKNPNFTKAVKAHKTIKENLLNKKITRIKDNR